jgi:hypothetical protein
VQLLPYEKNWTEIMSKDRKQKKPDIEEQLAAFTDQMLDENLTSSVEVTEENEELHELEETVSKLYKVLEDMPDEEIFAHMQAKIEARLQEQARIGKNATFRNWLKHLFTLPSTWHSQRSQQNLRLAISVAIIALIIIVVIPLLGSMGTTAPITATAQVKTTLPLIILSLVVIATIFWWTRRKP